MQSQKTNQTGKTKTQTHTKHTKTLIRIIPLKRNTEKAADKKRMSPGAKISRSGNKRSENPTMSSKKNWSMQIKVKG